MTKDERKRASILVVDDEPDMRSLLKLELECEGYQVTCAEDGMAALEQIQSTEFDLVISDVQMPRMSGTDLLKAIKESVPKTEVIIATAFADLETAFKCVKSGAYDLIQKPVNLEALLQTVARALERRRLHSVTLMYEASQAVLTNPDWTLLPKRLLDLACKHLSGDAAFLFLYGDNETLFIADRTGDKWEEFSTIVLEVCLTRNSEFIQHPHPELFRLGDGPHSSLIVHPLCVGERVTGLFAVCRSQSVRPFLPSDLNLAAVISAQLTLSLENTNLIQRMTAAERLVTIGTLSASIAHEINSPLTGLMMTLPLALKNVEKMAQVAGEKAELNEMRDSLSMALEATHRITEIMRDMLAMARGDKAASEMDLNDAVRAAFRIARAKIASEIEVKLDLDVPLTVVGSSGRLGQVFTNLLVNAAQALQTKEGPGHEISVRSLRDGNLAIMEVKDNGPGIAEANLSKLFTPFFTTKPVGTGTGLGLYICRQIVREHRGDIEVHSIRGEGTTFRIVLPAA